MDRAVGIFRRSVLPYLEKRDGFASALVFSCKNKHELIACTLWQSYRSMIDADRSGFIDQQVAKLSAVLTESAQGDVYELEIFS